MSGVGRVRPGDTLLVRDERWRVLREHVYAACSVVDVGGADPSNRGSVARFILPFERTRTLPAEPRPRIVSRRALARTMREVIGDAVPDWSSLRAAAGARLSLLPFQLEPALAMTRGLEVRMLLADDVGLGKTVQAGLLLAEVRAREPDARALIVTPAGLREQWRDELDSRFGIAAGIFDAAGIARAAAQVPSGVNPWSVAPVIITSIDFVKRPDVIRALEALVWDVVVFDEAHGLTGRSDRATAADVIAARGRRVLLLTATPHSGDERAFARLCALGGLGHTDAPMLMFRRGRENTGDFPARRTHVLRVTPTHEELEMHAELDAYTRRVWRDAPVDCVSGARLAMSVLARRAVSSAASLARSVERRAALLADSRASPPTQLDLPLDDDDVDDAEPADLLRTPGLSSFDDERAHLERIHALAIAATAAESKVRALRRLVGRIREPVIIFTDYRDTLDRLGQALDAGDAPRLHGGMDHRERRRQVMRFTHGDAPLLLATDAASEGLNLHHRCRLVINLEVPWTPLRFEQRVGRVNRLGQTQRTHVITLLARNTLEESIVATFATRMRRVHAVVPFQSESVAAAAFGGHAIITDHHAPHTNGVAQSATVEEGLTTRAHAIQPVTLREDAEREVERLGGVIELRTRRLRETVRATACHRSRPPAALVGGGRGTAAILWGARLFFVDELNALIWDSIAGVRVCARFVRPPRKAALLARGLDDLSSAAEAEMTMAIAAAQASQLDELTTVIRRATSNALRREEAIAAEILRTTGRLARPLVQPGLFDRRAIRQTTAQRELAEEALVRVHERIEELKRLRTPSTGGHQLLFVACLDA